jgi:hypothetical protein
MLECLASAPALACVAVDLQHRVGVGAPVEQEPGDLEVAVIRRGNEACDPVLVGVRGQG